MKVRFISDSSCDVLKMEGIDYVSIPMTITVDGEDFIDDENLDMARMLETLEHYKGRTFTACPSIWAWMQAFEGADVIYVVTLTSGLSGTYHSAVMARDQYLEKHPEAKIYVFDTLSTGPEQRLLLEKLVELQQKGLEGEEIVEQAKQYLESTRLYFVLQSVHNLAQNGRVNKVIAAAVSALGIRMLGTANEEGKISLVGKSRGDKRMLKSIKQELEKAGYKGGKVCISHVQHEEYAKQIAAMIHKEYKDAEISILPSTGLCSYYAERRGILIGIETNK